MHVSVAITVSAGKRLIAKGIAQNELVKRALDKGILAVAPGTTNGYVVEELTGQAIDKTQFVTGRTIARSYQGSPPAYGLPDLVLKNGQRVEQAATEAVAGMGPGDVLIKGANAINYDLQQAGVLIGHPTGGTLGAVLGTLTAKRIHLLHPVGLEKSVPGDLSDVARMMKGSGGKGPTLWVTPGDLFTEIEALELLAGVCAVPSGAGGIGGAEGAVWLTLFGEAAQLDQAQAVIELVQNEPAFLA